MVMLDRLGAAVSEVENLRETVPGNPSIFLEVGPLPISYKWSYNPNK